MTNSIKLFFGLLSFVAIMNSCTMQAYESETFESLPEKTVAILPYEVVFEGRTPRRISPEDLEIMATGDSQLFQSSLYENIVLRERRNKRFNLNVQDYNKTNYKLAQAGIGIKESWYKDPVELAHILGVDAVIRSSVHTRRYLSDGVSTAIAVTTTILDILSDEPSYDDDSPNTGDVFVRSTIIDRQSGKSMWSASENVATNYSLRADRAVDLINRRLIRRIRVTD